MGSNTELIRLHAPSEMDEIRLKFRQRRWSLIFGMLTQKQLEKNQDVIDMIADYYGEQFAFYIVWLIHYTHWLIYPAVFGLLVYGVQMIGYFQVLNDKSGFVDMQRSKGYEIADDITDKELEGLIYNVSTDTMLNTLYCLFVAIWSTCFMESWKRKEAYLGDCWLVR